MPPSSARIVDGKKFMWDGRIYEAEKDAQEIEKEYRKNNFETILIPEEGKYSLYTRRVAREVVVDE